LQDLKLETEPFSDLLPYNSVHSNPKTTKDNHTGTESAFHRKYRGGLFTVKRQEKVNNNKKEAKEQLFSDQLHKVFPKCEGKSRDHDIVRSNKESSKAKPLNKEFGPRAILQKLPAADPSVSSGKCSKLGLVNMGNY